MNNFIAQRIVFRNGERYSLLVGIDGIPVHEVTLFMGKLRNRGRAANTIHFACSCLAVAYREFSAAHVDLLQRLLSGKFLSTPELDRIITAARYRVADLEPDIADDQRNVIDIRRIEMRRRSQDNVERQSIGKQLHASRLRYIANYLAYITDYVAATLPHTQRRNLLADAALALKAFRAEIPVDAKRNRLGARVGLSVDEQKRVLDAIHPESPNNPWIPGFTRRRNWLIVAILLSAGIRRGELLGMQICDIHPRQPKIDILRRADCSSDSRTRQPNTKTYDRTIELKPSLMKVLQAYLKERRCIKDARSVPQVFVSRNGCALSMQAVDKLFKQLRLAVPDLSVTLTSHVMRHTWNERFSEHAEAMNLSEVEEQRARNNQQGWSDSSNTAAAYTRRHTERKGRELSLKAQEKIYETLHSNK